MIRLLFFICLLGVACNGIAATRYRIITTEDGVIRTNNNTYTAGTTQTVDTLIATNVGIRTTTPQAALDVNDNAIVSSNLTMGTGPVVAYWDTNGVIYAPIVASSLLVTNLIVYVRTNAFVQWGTNTTPEANFWRMGPSASTSFVFQVYDGANWTNALQLNRP